MLCELNLSLRIVQAQAARHCLSFCIFLLLSLVKTRLELLFHNFLLVVNIELNALTRCLLEALSQHAKAIRTG